MSNKVRRAAANTRKTEIFQSYCCASHAKGIHEVVPQLYRPQINYLAGRPSYGLLKEVDLRVLFLWMHCCVEKLHHVLIDSRTRRQGIALRSPLSLHQHLRMYYLLCCSFVTTKRQVDLSHMKYLSTYTGCAGCRKNGSWTALNVQNLHTPFCE